MKKLNILLIVSMLAVALLAANPPGKLVRLEINNVSGDTVYMKLEGRGTGAFYYLTVPNSTLKTFTVLVDSYKRTTWACGGITSKGSLVMTGNVKLKFVQCGTMPLRTWWLTPFYDLLGPVKFLMPDGSYITLTRKVPNFGEPTQEKVSYFSAYGNRGYAKIGAISIMGNSYAIWVLYLFSAPRWGTLKYPQGIYMRYKY
jgi:hypothetical protein